MSIWIRIHNLAFTVSVESYRGFFWSVHPAGIIVRLGCVGMGLIWDLEAANKLDTDPNIPQQQ